ncbi:MAG TPA: hypothetical protein VGI16_05270 [Candidatus Acidoferrum sp.]|jgi:anti-sigma regulatory factor (Ser/Thr protein kinase)
MQIEADPRLAAAAGGAARYFADAAGLENGPTTQLQAAVVTACEEAFGYLDGKHAHLDVTLTRTPDRIEVALAHEGGSAPALGLDTLMGKAGSGGQTGTAESAVFGGVDRVQYESQNGVAITRLTKYVSQQC